MRLNLLLALVLGLSIASPLRAETAPKLTSEDDFINYSVGYQMGNDFKNQGWNLEPEVMIRGIRDALSGSPPPISAERMKITLGNLKRKLLIAQHQSAVDYQKASKAFLEENAKKEGVVVLPDGVQYKVLRPGTGKTPTADDTVRIHFKLFKVDGTEVGSTYGGGNPRVVELARALPGLREVLTRMKVGARYQIVLPPGMAANNRERDDAGAAVYDLELVSIVPKK